MRKYGNKKVTVDGYKFDSKMEADFYYRLKILLFKKEILEFEVHPRFILQPAFVFRGKKVQAITYTSDFKVVYPNGEIHYVDIKGAKTNEFKIKEKMFKNLMKNEPNVDIYCLTLHKETWVKI